MRFERVPPVDGGKNAIEFDSSADRAIARNFGLREGSIELREIDRNSSQITFEVYARENYSDGQEPKPLRKRGILKQIPRDEILRRQAEGVFYGKTFQ